MDHQFLSRTLLFRGISPEELPALLGCLQARTQQFDKGEVIFHAGDTVTSAGLILSGSVCIESDDFWGNRSILDRLSAGQVFAETYACLPGEPLMISAVALEPCCILFLEMERVLLPCTSACTFHGRLIRNLVTLSAQKSLSLSRRIFHTGSKSIRGRLLSYLSAQAMQSGIREFEIPFNRQQLADYLSVDRSALSNELSKMQKDELILVDRNRFTLLVSPEQAAPIR